MWSLQTLTNNGQPEGQRAEADEVAETVRMNSCYTTKETATQSFHIKFHFSINAQLIITVTITNSTALLRSTTTAVLSPLCCCPAQRLQHLFRERGTLLTGTALIFVLHSHVLRPVFSLTLSPPSSLLDGRLLCCHGPRLAVPVSFVSRCAYLTSPPIGAPLPSQLQSLNITSRHVRLLGCNPFSFPLPSPLSHLVNRRPRPLSLPFRHIHHPRLHRQQHGSSRRRQQ